MIRRRKLRAEPMLWSKVEIFPAESTQPPSTVYKDMFLNINCCGHDSFPLVSFFHTSFLLCLPSFLVPWLIEFRVGRGRGSNDFRPALPNRFGNQGLHFHTEGMTYKSCRILVIGAAPLSLSQARRGCQSCRQSSRKREREVLVVVGHGRGRPFKFANYTAAA